MFHTYERCLSSASLVAYMEMACMFAKMLNAILFARQNPIYAVVYVLACFCAFTFLSLLVNRAFLLAYLSYNYEHVIISVYYPPLSPLFPLSIYFVIFCFFYFSLSFIGITYCLLLSIPSLSTRIVPLRFQAGGRRKRPNLGLVCFVCVICIP